MSVTIINGANVVARNVIRRLAPLYQQIKVYSLFKEVEGKKATLEKVMVTNTPSLEYAIEGSQKVLYFTHDYFSLAPDKNLMLQATAEITKKLGVPQTICVCPIEFDHYSGLRASPFEMRQVTENNALKCNPEMTLIQTNIIYGEESYMIKFLTQQMLTGRVIYPRLKTCDTQKYYPIHMNDVVNCIVHALENDQIKGLEYAIRGSKSFTFDGILDVLAKHCGQENFVKSKRSYITGLFEKFIVGRTHDKNMMKMIQWHEIERQNYKNDWSYLEKFKIDETADMASTYPAAKVNSDKYIEPYLYQYKRIALD